MKPHRQDGQGSQNAFGNMGMDTQRFASKMGSGASSSSTSSTDDAQAVLDLIDSDKSGDLSKSEVSSVLDKTKALFDTMQQMGAQQFQSTSSSLSVTARTAGHVWPSDIHSCQSRLDGLLGILDMLGSMSDAV